MKLTRLTTLLAIGALATFASADELVIRMVNLGQVQGVADDYSLIIEDSTEPAPFFKVRTTGNSPQHIEDVLNGDARVMWAEELHELTHPESQHGQGSSIGAIFDPTAMYPANSNALQQVGYTPRVNPFLLPRTAPRVAILDTGLSMMQPSLWRKVVASANTIGPGFTISDVPFGVDSNANGIADEAAGHGTMVAGIVSMLAPHSGLVIVRVADSDGFATSWSLIKGIAFAVSSGAKVINASLGSEVEIPSLSDVSDWLEEQQVILVSPIGNNGIRQALYPSRISNVFCVSGLGPNNSKAPFSNWHSKADFAAPSTGIQSAWWNGHAGIWNGTSFAAPFITGGIMAGIPNQRSAEKLRVSSISQALARTSKSISWINPDYADELGRLIQIDRFVEKLAAR